MQTSLYPPDFFSLCVFCPPASQARGEKKMQQTNETLDSYWAASCVAEGLGCSAETYRQQAVLKIHIYKFEQKNPFWEMQKKTENRDWIAKILSS